MDRADLRKLDLSWRERQGSQSERVDVRRSWRWMVRPAKGDEADRRLPLAVDVEQGVDLVVGEPEHDLCGKSRIGGHRQLVGERGRRVPIDVAIRAGLVAPGVTPEGARPDGDDGSGGDRRLLAGRRDDGRPVVSRAELAQAVIVRRILIDTRLQPRHFATDEVELQVVLRAGATGGPELELTPGRTPPALEQAIGPQTESGHRVQIRHGAGDLELTGGRYRIERGEIRYGEGSWQGYRLQRLVDLVRDWLDGGVLLANGLDEMGWLAHQNFGISVVPQSGGTEVLRRVVEPPRRNRVLVTFARHL